MSESQDGKKAVDEGVQDIKQEDERIPDSNHFGTTFTAGKTLKADPTPASRFGEDTKLATEPNVSKQTFETAATPEKIERSQELEKDVEKSRNDMKQEDHANLTSNKLITASTEITKTQKAGPTAQLDVQIVSTADSHNESKQTSKVITKRTISAESQNRQRTVEEERKRVNQEDEGTSIDSKSTTSTTGRKMHIERSTGHTAEKARSTAELDNASEQALKPVTKQGETSRDQVDEEAAVKEDRQDKQEGGGASISSQLTTAFAARRNVRKVAPIGQLDEKPAIKVESDDASTRTSKTSVEVGTVVKDQEGEKPVEERLQRGKHGNKGTTISGKSATTSTAKKNIPKPDRMTQLNEETRPIADESSKPLKQTPKVDAYLLKSAEDQDRKKDIEKVPPDEKPEDEKPRSNVESGNSPKQTLKTIAKRVNRPNMASLLKKCVRTTSLAQFARNDEHLKFIREATKRSSTDIPAPMQHCIREETLSILQATLKQYRVELGANHSLTQEMQKKVNELRDKIAPCNPKESRKDGNIFKRLSNVFLAGNE